MTIQDIVRQVRGTLSLEACTLLDELVKNVPTDGMILDFCPGGGLSTVVMAVAVQRYERQARIVAIDSHITNPLASKPVEEGTLLPFLSSLRTFRCADVVTPILGVPASMDALLRKNTANMVMIQIPPTHVDPVRALETSVQIAQYAIRRGGKIVAYCPFLASNVFSASLERLFGHDYAEVPGKAGLRIFESMSKLDIKETK
jgi:hypothetical protein